MRDHEAGVEEAGVADAVGGHALNGRADDFAHDLGVNVRRDDGSRGVGAHAARVGTLVGVKKTLVVLGGGHRKNVFAVDHHDEGGFLAVEEVLDHDAGAGVAEGVAFEHHVDRVMGFLFGHGDDYALAGGKAISLDDDRSALAADVGVGGFGIREGFVVGRRNIVTLHEGLGEVLGAFELRGGLRRAEDAQAGGAELVDDAGGERGFGTHDREGDVVALDEFDQLVDVGDRKVFKTGRQGRAGIAGSHENFGHAIALSEAPGESVFTTAVANNEKVHFDGLLETDRRGAPELWERAPRKVKFCRAPSMPELPVGTPYCTARGVRLSP